MSKFKTGDKVRYIGEEHTGLPRFYPTVGTAGVVDRIDLNGYCWVQWPKGTTSESDCWCCCDSDIELVENVDMTNEEIWDFLKNKMSKNGLVSKASIINTHVEDYPNNKVEIIKAYYEDDVHNAIALAYKVGYLRAMKGRPFKIGEKKKNGGYWVPVDPDNLPKEGTKVRYSRQSNSYSDDIIKVGDTGTIAWEGVFAPMGFGMNLDNPRSFYTWIDFSDGDENCLDMWVEDDE